MSTEDHGVKSPGSGGWLSNTNRKTELSLTELIAELQAAIDAHGDLGDPAHVGMLLGGLCAALDAKLDVHSNRFGRSRARELASWFAGHPAMSYELLNGGTFVELGCGGRNPLSSLAVLVAAGARRGVAIDLDQLDERLAMRALARTVIELIAEPSLYLEPYPVDGEVVRRRFAGLDIASLLDGSADGLGSSGLEYRRVSAEATGLEAGVVNGIASRSFLEHVPDVDAVIAEMARISCSGAVGTHAIDGMDHRHYASSSIGPLDFLTEGSDEPLVHECNRLRPLAFVDVFVRHGFEVLEVQRHHTVEVTERARQQMVEPWRSMPTEVLAVVHAQLVVRRR